MLSRSILRIQLLAQRNKIIQSFSEWKHPRNMKIEKTIFPSPEEMFPKENLVPFNNPTPITPSLVKEVLGIQGKAEPRATFMQFAKKNGQMYHIFDASRMPLGRLCQKAAFLLQGKHRPTFRNSDEVTYDNIIVVNAQNIMLTGKKAFTKTVIYHSGYVGGLKERPYKHYLTEKPEQLIYYCISKMLPKNKKRRELLKKIKIFREEQHNMKEFPNFIPQTKPLVDEKLYNPFLQDFDNLVIKYQSVSETPKELEGIKKDIDEEIEIPFDDRRKIFKKTPHNIKVMKVWKKYYSRLRRYKVHKIKPPKNRDPNLSQKSILVQSEKYIKEFKLESRVVPEEVPEEDDVVIKNLPKPKKKIFQ